MLQGNKKATINEIVNGQPVIPAFLSEGASDFIRYSLTKVRSHRGKGRGYAVGHLGDSAVDACIH